MTAIARLPETAFLTSVIDKNKEQAKTRAVCTESKFGQSELVIYLIIRYR